MGDNKIVRITIKSASGFGPIDEAYEDKITITDSSISYEYKPHEMSCSKTNCYKKWSYKTTSPYFKETFEKIADMTPEIMNCYDDLFVTDIGPTEIIATFSDKHKEFANFYCPSEFFREYFNLIKLLVPKQEGVPKAIWTCDDN